MNTLSLASKKDTNSDMQLWFTVQKDGKSPDLSSATTYKVYVLDLTGNSLAMILASHDTTGTTFNTSDFGKLGTGTFQLKLEIDYSNGIVEMYPNGDKETLITLDKDYSAQYPHLTCIDVKELSSSDIVPSNYNAGAPALHINNIDFTGTVVNMVDSGQPAKVYLNASHNLVFDIPKPVLTNDDLQMLKDYVDNDILNGKW